MKSYNNFSPQERAAGAAYHRRLRQQGLWHPPARCLACGQTEGLIDAHWEYYSRPFDTTRDLPLCARDHLMVHLRDRYHEAWTEYCTKIRDGYRSAPLFTRS